MMWQMRWLNRSITTINTTLQLLDIYRCIIFFAKIKNKREREREGEVYIFITKQIHLNLYYMFLKKNIYYIVLYQIKLSIQNQIIHNS